MKPFCSPGVLLGSLLATALPAAATTVTIGNAGFTQVSQYVASPVPSPEVHIIGLYDGGSSGAESNPTGQFIPGTTQVNVLGAAGGPVSLVLSAYEETHWVLTGPGVDSLTSVVLNGYHNSQVIGLDPAKVIDRTGIGNYWTSSAYAWPNAPGNTQTSALVAGVESLFGVPIASFTGIYSTSPVLGTVTSLESPAAYQVTVQLSAVPGPAPFLLLGTALGSLCLVRGRQSRLRAILGP